MPIGGGRLLFIFCYQKTTNIFFDRNLQNYLPHTENSGDGDCCWVFFLEGPPAASKASLAFCFCCCSYFDFNESTLWLSWLRNSSPNKIEKSATQINHSNEILPPTQTKSLNARLNAWRVIAIAISVTCTAVSLGGLFRRRTTENIN